MSHEAMVDLLKTSMSVTVTVIPPHPDGQPRRGCHLANCGYVYGALDPSLLDDDEFGGKPYKCFGVKFIIKQQIRFYELEFDKC